MIITDNLMCFGQQNRCQKNLFPTFGRTYLFLLFYLMVFSPKRPGLHTSPRFGGYGLKSGLWPSYVEFGCAPASGFVYDSLSGSFSHIPQLTDSKLSLGVNLSASDCCLYVPYDWPWRPIQSRLGWRDFLNTAPPFTLSPTAIYLDAWINFKRCSV